MSLETVLKIGQKLRSSKSNLKHFKQVASLQNDSKNKDVYCFKISVKRDYSIDIDGLSEIPENDRANLYYLKYKIGNDNTVKYIFGDVFFEKNTSISKDGKINTSAGGYYQLNDPDASRGRQNSSFRRGCEHAIEIVKPLSDNNILEPFRKAFSENESLIESILLHPKVVSDFLVSSSDRTLTELLSSADNLKDYAIKYVLKEQSQQTLKKIGIDATNLKNGDENKLYSLLSGSVFLHFEFGDGKHWYEFEEEFDAIKRKILSEFTEDTKEGVVLKKLLYKGIGSGDKSSDIQFPGFTTDSKHKVKSFDNDTILDLFYAVDFTNKGKFIKGTDIKRIVLPLGRSLNANHYLDFLSRNDESEIVSNNKINVDPVFIDFAGDISDEITSFDAIFCKKGAGVGTPDSDLIEISGIQKSRLQLVMKRITEIAEAITIEKKKYLKTEKNIKPFEIEYAFQRILGTPQFDEKTKKVSMKVNPKYQSHLLRILPLIYTENYFEDSLLIPAFIQNVEYSCRNGDPQYVFLSYDLKFLLSIQNTNQNKFNDMIETKSYQIGIKLGKLAKPLKKKINSFEKRYVGLLTRQISTKDDCIKFANDIHEKLVLHEKTSGQLSAEMLNELANLEEKDYDKEKLAFGFFEGYFKYEIVDKKKDFFNRIEKLLSDYEGNENLEDELNSLQNIVNNLK